MKVIVSVIFALASASAIGSGPYLPSGWRPQGPAFDLPSEAQKPADNPLQEIILIESEASGSEGLREYGSPQLDTIQESLNIVQTLPDVVTDQAFYVAEPYVVKVEEAVEKVAEYVENKEEEILAEVNAEPKSDIVETTEVVTEVTLTKAEELIDARSLNVDVEAENTAAVIAETVAVTEDVQEVTKAEELIDARSLNVDVEAETTASVIAETVAEDVQEVEATAAVITEALQNIVEEEKVEEVTKSEELNSAVVLGNLAIEVKAEQVQQIVEADSELKNQEGSASVQAPEGFLEYGPPGFREYGPPKADQLLRSSFENNEVRRRRFSPKFRSSKVLKH